MSKEKRRQNVGQVEEPHASVTESRESREGGREAEAASPENQDVVVAGESPAEQVTALSEQVENAVSEGSDNSGSQSVSISLEQSGPIPLPQMMAGYKEVDPDLPNRIMTMAEEQAADNRVVRRTLSRAAVVERRTGQWLAAAIALATIARDAFLGSTGLTTLVISLGVGVHVFNRLPEWWHSWRQSPSESESSDTE